MLQFVSHTGTRLCDGWTRREILRAGAIGLGGLTLPNLLRFQTAQAAESFPRAKARSVIILFLSGGPAQQDMWDMKPEAPEEVRGTFRPIGTNVPGIQITEHMPRLARHADKCAILRAVNHTQTGHPAAAYWMMVGMPIGRPARDAGFMSREDRPHPGSALHKLLGASESMPPFVMIPEAIQPNGPERSGQHAGMLGAAYDPYRVNSDPNLPDYSPGALEPLPGLSPVRFTNRRHLLQTVSRQKEFLDQTAAAASVDPYFEKAFSLVTSDKAQRAFDVSAEPDAVRDRYGRHVFGQSTLVARRLVEAGVRLVHVNWVRHDGGKGGQGYDSHRDHLNWAKNKLLPPTDNAMASLLEDLDERGLLDETLVIAMGEFGRTPRFNKNGGRDHWSRCFSLVMAGGGIRGGQVYGVSDEVAAYPVADAVTPQEVMATVYHNLGVDPHTLIYDRQNRPHTLVEGLPIEAIL